MPPSFLIARQPQQARPGRDRVRGPVGHPEGLLVTQVCRLQPGAPPTCPPPQPTPVRRGRHQRSPPPRARPAVRQPSCCLNYVAGSAAMRSKTPSAAGRITQPQGGRRRAFPAFQQQGPRLGTQSKARSKGELRPIASRTEERAVGRGCCQTRDHWPQLSSSRRARCSSGRRNPHKVAPFMFLHTTERVTGWFLHTPRPDPLLSAACHPARAEHVPGPRHCVFPHSKPGIGVDREDRASARCQPMRMQHNLLHQYGP